MANNISFESLPVIDMAGTARRINSLRLERGMSVKDIQAVFGFSTPQAVYKWIHGTALPTLDNMVILSALLEVPVNEILVVTRPSYSMKGGGDDGDENEFLQAVC